LHSFTCHFKCHKNHKYNACISNLIIVIIGIIKHCLYNNYCFVSFLPATLSHLIFQLLSCSMYRFNRKGGNPDHCLNCKYLVSTMRSSQYIMQLRRKNGQSRQTQKLLTHSTPPTKFQCRQISVLTNYKCSWVSVSTKTSAVSFRRQSGRPTSAANSAIQKVPRRVVNTKEHAPI
jgi:hypothetical protein